MDQNTTVALVETLERIADALEEILKVQTDIRDGRAYAKKTGAS